MFESTILQLFGLAVNIVSIATYLDFNRSGRKGFKRFLAFWLGFPITFFIKLFVGLDPALVAEQKLTAELPPEEADIGVPEYVRKEIRAIREARLEQGSDADPEA